MAASPEQREHAVERASRIFAVIRDAAERNQRCPSNAILAERFGVGATAIVNALHFLESVGMIVVSRSNASRIVTIRATGKQTAGKLHAPHWTERMAA